MDHHGAYAALLEPLRDGWYINTPALDSIPIAIMAHDPSVDLAGILAYHDVEIDVTDPREVQDLLARNFNLKIELTDEMPSDLFWDVRDSVMSLPEIPASEPWENAERILSKFTNDRIAKSIISAVDRLANLIRSEKVLELRKPDDPKSIAAGPTKPGRKRQPRSPGGNDFSI